MDKKRFYIEKKGIRIQLVILIGLIFLYAYWVTEDFVKTMFLIFMLVMFYVVARVIEDDGLFYTKKEYVEVKEEKK